MQYKALMLDVDGTLIPYAYDALPSDTVVKAIAKAKNHVVVSLVTGRSYTSAKPILKKLELTSGYAVINNGAAVIDIATDEVIYERLIDKNDLQQIISLFEEDTIPFFLKQTALDTRYMLGIHKKGTPIEKGSMLFTDEIFSSEEADEILRTLSAYPLITAHKQHHKHPHKFSISISHLEATKLHGIHEIARRLSLDPKTFIGVGDSYNDFPLLMACGLKVAMGNAVEDLKAIADYVAPSVHEDGVADVIEKFILNNSSHNQ